MACFVTLCSLWALKKAWPPHARSGPSFFLVHFTEAFLLYISRLQMGAQYGAPLQKSSCIRFWPGAFYRSIQTHSLMLPASILCCFKPAIICLIVTVQFLCVLASASLRLQHVRGLPAPVGIPKSDGAGLCFCDARLPRTCMSAQHLAQGHQRQNYFMQSCQAVPPPGRRHHDRAQLQASPVLRFRSTSTVFQVYTGSLPRTASFAHRKGSNLQFSMKGCFRASSFAG